MRSGRQETHVFDWDGDGLDSDERRYWRSRLAYTALLEHLVVDRRFQEAVTRVRAADEPGPAAWREAAVYGTIGHRRRLVGAWIVLSASAATIGEGRHQLLNLGVRAVTVSDDVRTERRNTYLVGEAFLLPLEHAARCLARRAAEELAPDDERAIRRAVALAMETVRVDVLDALVRGTVSGQSPAV